MDESLAEVIKMLEAIHGVKLEEPKPLTPEEREIFRKKTEEWAKRPMTEERIRALTRDGQEDI